MELSKEEKDIFDSALLQIIEIFSRKMDEGIENPTCSGSADVDDQQIDFEITAYKKGKKPGVLPIAC